MEELADFQVDYAHQRNAEPASSTSKHTTSRSDRKIGFALNKGKIVSKRRADRERCALIVNGGRAAFQGRVEIAKAEGL